MNYIIKTIHGCNLSCIYCYEQSHNRLNLRMGLDDAKGFIRKVHDYYVCSNPEEVLAFHWHGGEPMLMGAAFFEQVLEFQARVLGAPVGEPLRTQVDGDLFAGFGDGLDGNL